MYVAASYEKDLQKLSSYAVVKDADVPLLCKINFFVRWTPCDLRCALECDRCPARYFCIVELYERTIWEAHTTPNVRLSYLNRVVPTGVVRAFPLEAISQLCFLIRVGGKDYIACPVNDLEIE